MGGCVRLKGIAMIDRTELLETALDSLPDGIAVFGEKNEVILWNHAAEAITGYAGMDLKKRQIPEVLEPLLQSGPRPIELVNHAARGALVRVRHKLGHEVPLMARALVLRDGMGGRMGMAAVFHPAESLDALPHSEMEADTDVAASQADLEDRLQSEFEDLAQGGAAFGVLWIGVDQARELRRTHGASACQAMLEKVRHALAAGLRPSEVIGRWGDDEFLVIAHERTPEMLAAHAHRLAGLARTADFRWWGDRVSLTVSIGAAQAQKERDETGQDATLAQLLERARNAMEYGTREGGNRTTLASSGVKTCSPS
jgi:diguanylate cyclase (GGDEF)-like protein/PAS domain S-box-containing protein